MANDSALKKSNKLLEDDLELQLLIIKNIGELIIGIQNIKEPINKDVIRNNLNYVIERYFNGEIAKLAHYLNIPKSTLWNWCKGKNKPSLENVLLVSIKLNIPIMNLVTNNNNLILQDISMEFNFKAIRKKLISKNKINDEKLKEELNNIINNKSNYSPSMTEVAKQIGLNKKILYKKFPELCKVISSRYLNFRKEESEKRKSDICSEIKKVTIQLHNNGIYPSRRKVESIFTKPGILRRQEFKLSWKKALKDLGYSI